MRSPHLDAPEAQAALRDAFTAHGRVRVPRVLDDAEAARLLATLRDQAHPIDVAPDGTHQLWRHAWVPEAACDHRLCALGRWLWGDGRAWVEGLVGQSLRPDPSGTLVSDRFAKGAWFDPYDDGASPAVVAFQLHLAPSTWPASFGGHLELRDAAGTVHDTLAPAWNALDLFDVRSPGAWRRLPMIREHLAGYVVSGWYWAGPPR